MKTSSLITKLKNSENLSFEEIQKFQEWADKKTEIQRLTKIPFFSERDIWWISVGKNIGNEQEGKGKKFLRPVLIIRKFNTQIFYGIPLSSKIKNHNKYYFSFVFKNQEISALISQMKLFDAKRLQDKMGRVSHESFTKIKNSFIELF